ncbi:G-type lectin S-receptor-like serine/threonine-protein kinase SD3-1 [Mercurialis annua]|uniref:G-type lectin S-receptor-like serine/threonine-protein kinase SD3-1 n=1 Tax=Mercurialis annua TaxID=3986 RepID=UPI00216027F2|nr:G-type lectin S-receptor-like serine/threonine-protein kinase SD3-1 [Mercurialis annua]
MLTQDKFFNVLLFLSTGFCLFYGVLSQIHLGSTLTVEENNSWVSPSGDFAVRFFNCSDQFNQFSVGIHFSSNSIPVGKQTVVWIAGADVTVGNRSFFQLSQNGELVLVDSSKGVTVWSSKTSELGVVSAFLRDDGNFVLLDKVGAVAWQSFDNPTDTLLPGQSLSVNKMLRAASRSPVSSYYSLYMNASGDLQLRWESNVKFWTSGNPSASNLSAVLTSNGVLQIVNQTLDPMWSVFGEDHNDTVLFRLLRLDVDGNLRMYSWVNASQSWRSVWQAVDNQCNVFATCGHHGICVYNSSGSPECQCPLKTTSDFNSKCFEQNCGSVTSMVTYEHTFLYQIYPPSDTIVHTSLEECQSFCSKDPDCTAVTFTNDGTAECRIKNSKYFSGYSSSSLSSISSIKTCADPIAVDPHRTRTSAKSATKAPMRLCIPCLVGTSSVTFVVLTVIQFAVGCYIYRRRNMMLKKAALLHMGSNSKGLMMLSYAEIKDITGNFKHQIGPKMYRGVLPNHQPVAIKDLETSLEERKFRAAVSKIGSIHHKNLVKLNGYCCDSGERLLIYEYVKNGSVDKFIVEDELCKRLSWRRRVEIWLGVARAIAYLHTECREFISHGNLKCENVVLDKNFQAKVSEFGLGKVHDEAASYVGEKDVEDFGKMVLILVTGCREVEDVCEWAYKEWIEGHPESVVDKRIDDGVDMDELERTLRIAFWCLQTDERMRPSMSEVVKVLEGTLTVDPPPPPFDSRKLPTEEESPLESGSEC